MDDIRCGPGDGLGSGDAFGLRTVGLLAFPVDPLDRRGRNVAVCSPGDGRATRRPSRFLSLLDARLGPFSLDGGLHAPPQLPRQRRGRRSRHGRSGPGRAPHTLWQFTAVLFI